MRQIEGKDVLEFVITENETILQAMKLLEKLSRKILFVHCGYELRASLTDGDIRRWILKGGSLDATVRYAANYEPKYLYEQQVDQAMYFMKKYGIDALPVMDKGHAITKIIFANDLVQEHGLFGREIPVVIMAGGHGTRLLPYTNILPKPLIPIGDYPVAELIINRFCAYGCKKFYMIVNYKRNMIKAYFNELDKEYCLDFIEEGKPLGTGGGLSLLKGKINDSLILTNCDILIDDDLTKAYRQHVDSGNLITMMCSLKNFTIPYGVVDIGENGMIRSMQEKPNISFFTNTGCYFVEPEVIDGLEYNEPVDFPVVIEKYRNEGKKVGIYPIGEEAWFDMGQLDELERMKVRLRC